jgi:hypothetical protein
LPAHLARSALEVAPHSPNQNCCGFARASIRFTKTSCQVNIVIILNNLTLVSKLKANDVYTARFQINPYQNVENLRAAQALKVLVLADELFEHAAAACVLDETVHGWCNEIAQLLQSVFYKSIRMSTTNFEIDIQRSNYVCVKLQNRVIVLVLQGKRHALLHDVIGVVVLKKGGDAVLRFE